MNLLEKNLEIGGYTIPFKHLAIAGAFFGVMGFSQVLVGNDATTPKKQSSAEVVATIETNEELLAKQKEKVSKMAKYELNTHLWKQKKLDEEALKAGFESFPHRTKDPSIVGYQKIKVTRGTLVYDMDAKKEFETGNRSPFVVKTWIKNFVCPSEPYSKHGNYHWHYKDPETGGVRVVCTARVR